MMIDARRKAKVMVSTILLVVCASSTGLAATLPLSTTGLTVYRTCVLTANPSTTTVDFDARIDQDAPTTNNGTLGNLQVRSRDTGRNRRAYIRFDITKCSPAIPSSATVKLSTLKLFVSALPAACRTHDLFRVNAAWSESTITWNNQPFGTAENNPTSGSRTDTLNVGPATCQNQTNLSYVSGWNVTTDVQNIVNLSNANNGWMIRDHVESESGTIQSTTYEPKDANNSNPDRVPVLTITYTV